MYLPFQHTAARRRLGRTLPTSWRWSLCFNTQPPEGGWAFPRFALTVPFSFNTQPPEGGWFALWGDADTLIPVSTHSRPKAAGCQPRHLYPLVAGFNTQPPEGGWHRLHSALLIAWQFQHTAARRRLDRHWRRRDGKSRVSTHSRPKAAGAATRQEIPRPPSFNTQPPEGGWVPFELSAIHGVEFQHTAARRRLVGEPNQGWQP